MTVIQKFCTGCGATLPAGMKFCTRCGQPIIVPGTAGQPVPADQLVPAAGSPAPAQNHGMERVLGIVPFIEQGLLSVIHYTLIITDRRLVFRPWDPDTDEEMSDADDAVMQESCEIGEIKDEIAHFRAKDWSEGPWKQFLSMAPDTIAAGAPGTIAIPVRDISDANIVCETMTSTQDRLQIRFAGQEYSFDLMYSQGPYVSKILSPLLGDRLTMEDHLHRRGKLDRLLSGQEYR